MTRTTTKTVKVNLRQQIAKVKTLINGKNVTIKFVRTAYGKKDFAVEITAKGFPKLKIATSYDNPELLVGWSTKGFGIPVMGRDESKVWSRLVKKCWM